MSTFTPFAEKMESAGVSAAAVNAFSRCYEALVSNHSGMIPETDILPADQVEDWQDITASTPAADKDLISRCVCIKLNGGLGTSMGLQKAKSLLKVKGEDTFLDLIVRQVKHLRSISGTPVRLLHQRGHAGLPGKIRGGRLCGPRRSGAAAKPRSQNPGGRPLPGQLPGTAGAGMVSARPWGPVSGPAGVRLAGPPAGGWR